jgi:putative DNA topoisomerase
MAQIDTSLFSASQHALENAYGRCPECDAQLSVKHSKNGPFLGCTTYPSCTYTKPLHEQTPSTIKVMEGSSCPVCSEPLAIKKGRYGLFVGCTNFPECHHIESTSTAESTQVKCPSCKKGDLNERTNKYGKQFFACDQYPQCRYLVNFPPVKQTCPECGWGIMVRKTSGDTSSLVCPQKACQHKVDLSDKNSIS